MFISSGLDYLKVKCLQKVAINGLMSCFVAAMIVPSDLMLSSGFLRLFPYVFLVRTFMSKYCLRVIFTLHYNHSTFSWDIKTRLIHSVNWSFPIVVSYLWHRLVSFNLNTVVVFLLLLKGVKYIFDRCEICISFWISFWISW